MTIADAALAARDYFSPPDAITMLAIAGAESAFNPKARGDSLSSFTEAQRERYGPFTCADYCSIGLWQIFMPVHMEMLERLSGLSGACPIANWLTTPANNARAAKEILDGEGFSAWSVYNGGQYERFVTEAQAALFGLPTRPSDHVGIAVTAISLSGDRIHIDREDGTFDERKVAQATPINGWLRLDLDTRLFV